MNRFHATAPSCPTHNRHLDTARQIVAGMPHPTPLDQHELDCARRLARNAYAQLQEALKLVKADNVLNAQADTALHAVRRLGEAAAARMHQGRAH